MIKAPLRVETARLILSPPTANDVPAIYQRYASDPDVTRFMSFPRHESLKRTEEFVAFSAQEWERAAAGPYLIWSRADGSLLGGSGLECKNEGEAVTGYVLAKDAWGRGYATEALNAVVGVASSLGLQRLTACCHLEHRASQRVLEKCGFRREARACQSTFPNLGPDAQSVAWYVRELG
jgi:[ribosomal protein S5]-alanine N-acetyltransferase